MDTDKNGTVSRQEWDENGKQTVQHYKERIDQRRDKVQEIKTKFDADADGKLSEAERDTMRKKKEEMNGGEGAKEKFPKLKEKLKEKRDDIKERFDTDKDGVLSEAEREVAKKTIQSEMIEKHAQRFKDIDTSGDGIITREEFDAHSVKMMPKPEKR